MQQSRNAWSTRWWSARIGGTRFAFFAAVVVGGTATVHATEPPTMAEAGPIRDHCVAAKFSLQTAWAYAADRDATYWSAFRAGQTETATAYKLTLTAPWPASLDDTQIDLEATFMSVLSGLSKYANPKRSYRTSDIRATLDKQIERLDATAQVLRGVMPSDPPPATSGSTSPSAPAPAPAADTIAVLAPGTGFTGPTSQPAAIGTGTGSDAKAIARWDTVPYQTFAGRLTVGVVAFHIAGIDRVEFSVNGGTWAAVRSMSQNPTSGLWEYNAHVDASSLADGAVEVRAVVFPKVGVPRVLAGPHDGSDTALVSGEYSLTLSANSRGTLSAPVRHVSPTGDDTAGDGSSSKPFKTIRAAAGSVAAAADGATILLAAGDYDYPTLATPASATKRWLTLEAAPGVGRDKVRIRTTSGSTGLGAKLVHLKGLTVSGAELPDVSATAYDRIWAEGCMLEGSGPLDPTRFFPLGVWTGGIYVTECTIRNVKYPAYGHMLTRNTRIDSIGGDAFREPSGLVANCEVTNVVNLDDTHNDVVQFWDPQPRSGFENVIFYGLRAVENIDAQALFVQQPGSTVRYDNFAFVNYLTYATIGGQWQNPGSHLLLWNVEMLSPPASLSVNKGGFMFCDLSSRPTSVTSVSVRNSVFQRFNLLQTGAEPSLTDTTWASNNHYVDVLSYLAIAPGAGATTGGTLGTLVTDPVTGNFEPATSSPLLSRVAAPLVPADVGLRTRKAPDAVGAVAPVPAGQ